MRDEAGGAVPLARKMPLDYSFAATLESRQGHDRAPAAFGVTPPAPHTTA